MALTINIHTSGAATVEPHDVAALVHGIADRLEGADDMRAAAGIVWDYNGNRSGQVSVMDDDRRAAMVAALVAALESVAPNAVGGRDAFNDAYDFVRNLERR